MNKVHTKVAVVTGSGHGIGQAIAERLSRDGITVIINYAHSQIEAEALASKLVKQGGKAISLKADMGNPGDIRAMFVEVDRLFGRLDILINNAAITKGAPLADITEALMEEVFAVNSKGAITASQEAAKRLGQGGRIVNISSSTTLFPMVGSSLYAGSKTILKLFTEVWARELGPRGETREQCGTRPNQPGQF